MATMTTTRTLKFDDGAVQFRQRIAVSLLSHRNLLLRNIRNDAEAADVMGGTASSSIGLRDYEVSFLRLIDALTNGTVIEINNTGTQLRFRPGTLIGGNLTVPHQCPTSNSRSISWFLEGLWPILPFCKEAVSLTLVGITEGRCRQDASVDYWKNNLPSVLRQFGIDTITSTPGSSTTTSATTTNNNQDFFDAGAGGFSLRILNRSCDGDGRVHVSCPIVRSALTPIDWTDMGRYKRIRGLVKSANASQTARVAYAAKGVLQQLLPDVWIHTERIARTAMTKTTARNNNNDEVEDATTSTTTSRLTVTLTVESTTSCTFTTETAADRRALPEDVGHVAAAQLLHALHAQGGGVVDGGGITPLVLLYMCLTPEDVSRVRCGALSPYTIASLRLYHEAFGVEFKITPEYGEQTKTVLLSCLGTGYRNMARAST
jgi:RNA 3'-terminal phosphate cyclase-like protein